MANFASGKNAWGRCQRCGDRVRYLQLRKDGDNPNLMVCGTCYDIPHPAEKPFVVKDPQILKNPAPDTDDDSVGDSGVTLAEMFENQGEEIYFGGGT